MCRKESVARRQTNQQMSRYLGRPIQSGPVQSSPVQSKARSKSTCLQWPSQEKEAGTSETADGMVDGQMMDDVSREGADGMDGRERAARARGQGTACRGQTAQRGAGCRGGG